MAAIGSSASRVGLKQWGIAPWQQPEARGRAPNSGQTESTPHRECRSQKLGGQNGPSEAPRGRLSVLGGAWPDPKGPGRCLPTPWVPWVRAVPIGPLRWPEGRSRGPESAVLPSGAVVGTHPVRPYTCTMRLTQVPELPLVGPHAPRGPTRSLGWAGGGCFGLQRAPAAQSTDSGGPDPGATALACAMYMYPRAADRGSDERKAI